MFIGPLARCCAASGTYPEAVTYDDDRLAAIYDIDNPDGPDHDYFRAFVDESDAAVVTDLGCGTGILTVTLAAPGRKVIGIDPARAMLARAASRPGGDGVEWRLGTSERILPDSTDVVIMSGNVAMHIVGDQWHRTLRRIASGLRPGGRLAFETRNPAAKAWENWNEPIAERDTPAGRIRESQSTEPPDPSGVVTMHCSNQFLDDGAVLDIDLQLQFRTCEQVTSDLANAGLHVAHVWRDWQRTPFTDAGTPPLMIFEVATQPAN